MYPRQGTSSFFMLAKKPSFIQYRGSVVRYRNGQRECLYHTIQLPDKELIYRTNLYTNYNNACLCHYLYPIPHSYPNKTYWKKSKSLPEITDRFELNSFEVSLGEKRPNIIQQMFCCFDGAMGFHCNREATEQMSKIWFH